MKILIIDDEYNFVNYATNKLREDGLVVDGIVMGREIRTHDRNPLSYDDMLKLFYNANVIFLDHNMPNYNGEELFRLCQEQGIDLTNKRVIGISAGVQPYLHEQCGAYILRSAIAVKNLLGIK